MTQLTNVKQNIHEHIDKSCNKKHKLTAHPGCVNCLCELWLTVPIEEAARCQYKNSSDNIPPYTITLDVVNGGEGEHR